ncbi:GIY-YIG nuclease family protein [Paraburkholderia strydomiana]|uniref:GIY-YIG nuclease family protein n=1 Tax=Paraburkholderia strydomiana TaxID=1245417 RepID=UPI0038BCD5A5
MKRPSFQFYPGDWMNDAALRMVSVSARGLWMDMLCLMHQGSPYGHLKVNSKAINEIQLARLVGANSDEVSAWMRELSDAGVYSTSEDGVIFSRRMVKDENLREVRASGGKEGGNPKLMGGYNKPGFVYAMLRQSDGAVKIGISQDPSKRLYKVRAQYPSVQIDVIGKAYVDDMGSTEAALHQTYSHCKNGEWFALTGSEREELLNFHLKVNSKAIQTPSSSSSSSTSSPSESNKRRAPRFDPQAYLESLCVDSIVAQDWITHRKAKRAAPTQTAIDGINREAEKAGVSLQAALKISCQRGWQGFEAGWMKGAQGPPRAQSWSEKNDEVIAQLTGRNRYEPDDRTIDI